MAISTALDHFRTIADWAIRNEVDAILDVKTFQLNLRRGTALHRLYPLFPAQIEDRFVHVNRLTEDAIGFGGWLPYQSYRSKWSTDKLLFKTDAQRSGLRTPATWPIDQQPNDDYVLKRSQGSFGYDITGPFRASQAVESMPVPNPSGRGRAFTEQFIQGQMAKIWYWGNVPFFVHLQDFPKITGDGSSTAHTLATARIDSATGTAALADQHVTSSCLAFQGVDPSAVLEFGRKIWIDFRYGRTFDERRASKEKNSLSVLQRDCSPQLGEMGVFVSALLAEVAGVPLMCSVDAVLDAEHRLWWLEMNTNSIVPHPGYDVILAALFDSSTSTGMPKLDAITH